MYLNSHILLNAIYGLFNHLFNTNVNVRLYIFLDALPQSTYIHKVYSLLVYLFVNLVFLFSFYNLCLM